MKMLLHYYAPAPILHPRRHLMEIYLPISLGCRAHQRTSVLSEGQVARGCNSRNYMSRGLVGVA